MRKSKVEKQNIVATSRKKKPFFLRWWFVLLAIVALVFIIISINDAGEKFQWDDIVLGEMLPKPSKTKGEIHCNTTDELWIDINKISDKEYKNYIRTCKKDFAIEAETETFSYTAYNKKGYKLTVDYDENDKKMTINLEKPMEMQEIIWPKSTAGKQLPEPESKTGQFSYDNEEEFFVYIGNTTKDDYEKYIETCSEKGFNVDYSKDENSYYADNAEGWSVSIRYEGNNVMSISISAPEKENTNNDTVENNKDTQTTTDINSEFKKAMDSYEKFIDEYVAIVKKYNANPTDIDILDEYNDYMTKYIEFVEAFEKWEDEDLNSAELAYYIDVQTRVNKKLLEVAQ